MPYNPGVQDISGQLLSRGMEQAALMRSQAMGNLGGNIAGAITTFQKKKEQDEEFTAKSKSLENFIKTHADDFAPVDPQTGQKNTDVVLQFLGQSPDENAKQKYLRLGSFLDTALTGTKMQQQAAQTRFEKARAETAEAELKDIKDSAKWNETYGNIDVLGNLMGGGKPSIAAPISGAGMGGGIPNQAPINAAAAAIAPEQLPAVAQFAPAAQGGVPHSLARFAPSAAPAAGPESLGRFAAPPVPAAEEQKAAVSPQAAVEQEAAKMRAPTVADAKLLAQQWNQGRRPTGPQVREAQEWLQKQYDATTKETHLTERDKAYKILEDAFVENSSRKPNAQEKSELLQRAATIGTVGFAQGMPMMNADGSFAGFTVQDKKTGDVKLFVPGKEELQSIPKGATPSTQGSFTKSVLPMPEFQKLRKEVTDDEISLDRYSKYVNTVGGARQGIDLIADQVAGKITTLFNNKKLTQDQINAAMASGQLQGLIGASRLNTVGGGVMTEKDAERVILRLGGDVGALQNKEVVARAIADLYSEKYRRYQDSLSFYNSAVDHYYNQQGFSRAKPVEFDPKMAQSGNEMYGPGEAEKKLAALRKRKQELEAKAKGGKTNER